MFSDTMQDPIADANCWLHLRHSTGFNDEMFARFESGCRLWNTFVQADLQERSRLGISDGEPSYKCLAPTLSDDKRVATLPLIAVSTVGSRAHYQDGGARFLSSYFPFDFMLELEEGLTEELSRLIGPQTNWRPLLSPE